MGHPWGERDSSRSRSGKSWLPGSGNQIIRLQARVDPDLARVLREPPLSRDQKITLRDGRHTLTATVRRSWQLVFYILSQGERMTILKPKSLRDEIVATLRRSIEQYESA
ncbi:MAG: WYL domain-containing protein [Verrucomicrobiae bacterium]|nr:WYL domain-containing protein [Verrucomicrobiae bacterium]MCP5544469.1 WYL domain-containing protein [Akkermansiaceae bacterium]